MKKSKRFDGKNIFYIGKLKNKEKDIKLSFFLNIGMIFLFDA